MKPVIRTSTLFPLLILVPAFLFAVPKASELPILPAEKQTIGLENIENLTIDQFLELTPKSIQQMTGEKLSIKQAIGLKIAQKKVKKQLKKGGITAGGDSQLVALILVLLVGALGIHRFYLGYIGIGIIQLLTLGGCGIWALIDMIRIITGDLQPKNGVYDETI